ncbi:MAG TPA: NUDIX hydrolase [Salinimicrobium sp.]|nr:NUDIX hydrolase [Salinimicrobium sp.]
MGKQEISVSTDSVIFYDKQKILKLLLVRRKAEPFKGKWALPGGFVKDKEALEEAAKRELKEETGLKIDNLNQIKAFGAPGRDPRGRTITIAFWGSISAEENIKANDDAADAKWFRVDQLPELAFDHQEIIEAALILYRSEKA